MEAGGSSGGMEGRRRREVCVCVCEYLGLFSKHLNKGAQTLTAKFKTATASMCTGESHLFD